jgi:hypothetical protein
MTQSKNSPEQWRCPSGGDVCPRLVRWWMAVIMAGAPAIRTFAVIFATSHHGQRGWDEYSRSVVREGDFCPNSLKIKRLMWMIWHLASCTEEENRSGILEPTTEIMRGVLGTSVFAPSEPCNAPFTVNGDRACMSTTSTRLMWQGSKEGGPSRPRL